VNAANSRESRRIRCIPGKLPSKALPVLLPLNRASYSAAFKRPSASARSCSPTPA
jgi:hypothetical protein